MKAHGDGAERLGLEVVHLVDQEQGTGPAGARDLADLEEKRREIGIRVTAVRGPRRRLDLDAGREPGRTEGEGLHDAERLPRPRTHPFLAAHRAQQPERQLGERCAEVGLRADLADVGGGPPLLAGEQVELEQQHRLADAAEAGEDQAAVGRPRAHTIEDEAELLELLVAAGEFERAAAGAGGVRVVSAVHKDQDVSANPNIVGVPPDRRSYQEFQILPDRTGLGRELLLEGSGAALRPPRRDLRR